MTAYSQDVWLWPLTTTPGTDNVLVVTEDPGGTPNVITVTLHQDTTSTADETWYMHDDTSYHATKPGLLYAIQKLLNDGTTVGCGTVSGSPTYAYSWEVATPTGSTGLTNNGITLKATAPAADFEITWTSGSSTFDATILGHTLAAPVVDQASSTSGLDEVCTFSRACKYRLLTRDFLGVNASEDKRGIPYKLYRRSSERPSDSNSVIWDSGNRVRTFVYKDVPGVEIYENRAKESEWAAQTTRSTNDNHSVWHGVWDSLTNGDEVIVVHNTSSDLQVDANSYEVGKLWVEWETLEDMAFQTNPGGDLNDIVVPLWIDASASSYNH